MGRFGVPIGTPHWQCFPPTSTWCALAVLIFPGATTNPKMYGAGYDAGLGGTAAMDLLAMGAQVMGTGSGDLRDTCAATRPEAQTADELATQPVTQEGDGRGAEQSAGGENVLNWPSYVSLDQTKLAHARNISCDNAPGKTNLSGFKPATEKPRHRELWQAVMERDPTNRPKNWSMETCVKWLLDPANKPSPDSAPGGTGPAGPEVAAEDERVGTKEDDGSAPRLRWSRNYLVRLLHVISSLPKEFMDRNRKLGRLELDANSKDAFWEKAAQLFNSDTEFHLIKPRSASHKSKYDKLSGAPTEYKALASKLKSEFGEFRAPFSKSMTSWKSSGQGANPAPEKKDEDPNALYGADFENFTGGDLIQEYCFDLNIHNADLLTSHTCAMPKGAAFNATSGHSSTAYHTHKHNSKRKRQGKAKDMASALSGALKRMPPGAATCQRPSGVRGPRSGHVTSHAAMCLPSRSMRPVSGCCPRPPSKW